MDLEKRLERLEKLVKGLWIGLAAGLAVAGLACVLSLVAIFLRPAAPASVQPPEKAEPVVEARKTSYLDELERLETLKSKGAITQQEFDAKKQQLLAAAPPPVPAKTGDMDELDKLLRSVQALYNQNTITLSDYNTKKQQYLQRKITVTDLTKDLKKGEKLYNENILTLGEWTTLKQQLLAADPAAGKK